MLFAILDKMKRKSRACLGSSLQIRKSIAATAGATSCELWQWLRQDQKPIRIYDLVKIVERVLLFVASKCQQRTVTVRQTEGLHLWSRIWDLATRIWIWYLSTCSGAIFTIINSFFACLFALCEWVGLLAAQLWHWPNWLIPASPTHSRLSVLTRWHFRSAHVAFVSLPVTFVGNLWELGDGRWDERASQGERCISISNSKVQSAWITRTGSALLCSGLIDMPVVHAA